MAPGAGPSKGVGEGSGGGRGDLVAGPLRIPAAELSYEAVRSGGPGGQNVNKVATQIQLRFSVRDSRALTEEQRARIEGRLGHRLTKDGVLLLRASRYREQSRNLEDARERLALLLEAALERPKARKATRPGRGARERRLRAKKRRSEIKRTRRDRPGAE